MTQKVITKPSRMQKKGIMREKAIEKYKKKIKKLTRKQKHGMKMESLIKLARNCIRDIPASKENPVYSVWMRIIKEATKEKGILENCSDEEFSSSTLHFGDKVQLRGRYTGTDLEKYAGSILVVKEIAEDGRCKVSKGKKTITVFSTQIRRVKAN